MTYPGPPRQRNSHGGGGGGGGGREGKFSIVAWQNATVGWKRERFRDSSIGGAAIGARAMPSPLSGEASRSRAAAGSPRPPGPAGSSGMRFCDGKESIPPRKFASIPPRSDLLDCGYCGLHCGLGVCWTGVYDAGVPRDLSSLLRVFFDV